MVYVKKQWNKRKRGMYKMHKSILGKCSIKKILTRVVAAAAVVTVAAGQSVMYAPTIYAVEQRTQANEITQEKTFNYD